MTKFQVLGIASLLFILITYLRKFRRPALDKLFIGFLMALGIFFVLDPEVTNQLAHFLGIGRGADFLPGHFGVWLHYPAFILKNKKTGGSADADRQKTIP